MSNARPRQLGIVIGTMPTGANNAITDVPGVRVGHTTIIRGDGRLVMGDGPVRTGVTVIQPHEGDPGTEPVFAGAHRLNGNGELTGLEWVRESGLLTSPIALTNTHSVGIVHDALISAELKQRADPEGFWRTPVVGETWDGVLNDTNGMHVKAEHVYQALQDAASGPVAEGNVGSGTGMICHAFKGGIGTASRVIDESAGGYHVGVLVQANHARRERLQINGVPIGREIPESEVPGPELWTSHGHLRTTDQGIGSIIIMLATDAPLLPSQCARLAQRATMGIARTGGVGEHFSGDIFLAFATGNRGLPSGDYSEQVAVSTPIEMYANAYMTHLFDGAVEATEEAIINALFAAETMVGRDDNTVHELPVERTLEILRRHDRLAG